MMKTLGAAMVAAALLASACTSSEPEASVAPTPTPATSSSPAPSPSPSPTESSPSPSQVDSFPASDPEESPELAAIREGWEKHETELDRYMKDPDLTDLTALQATTTGQEAIDVVNDIVGYRTEGIIREGDLVFRNLKITDPEVNASGVNVAILEVCKDLTQQQLVDAETGKPIEAGEGYAFAKTLQATLTMEQLPAENWVVANGQWENERC